MAGLTAMGVLYERVDISNTLSRFVVGRPRPKYGLPVAIILKVLLNIQKINRKLLAWSDIYVFLLEKKISYLNSLEKTKCIH